MLPAAAASAAQAAQNYKTTKTLSQGQLLPRHMPALLGLPSVGDIYHDCNRFQTKRKQPNSTYTHDSAAGLKQQRSTTTDCCYSTNQLVTR
jgi:hypothetical protein